MRIPRIFDNLTIRSKLLLMLFGVGLVSANLIGWLSYRNGRTSIEERVKFQLRSMREARSNVVKNYFAELKRQVQTLSEDQTTILALKDLSAAYHELNKKPLSSTEFQQELDYYKKVFVPHLKETTGADPIAEAYMPSSAAGRYVQYHYMVSVPEDERRQSIRAPDGSHYSEMHGRYHPYLARICERFGYDDIMLFDPSSQEFVYAVWKEADYGVNIENGPLSTTALAHVVREVMRKRDRGSVVFSDFEPYRVTYGNPSAFIASPVYDGAKFEGVLVIQLPIDELNRVMTSFGRWEQEGFGKTGETYIVGKDNLMRSVSRYLVQDKKGYLESLKKAGYSDLAVRRIDQFDTSILQQEIQTPFAKYALAGKQGVMRANDYRGVEVLGAYAPLRMEGLNWGIVAQSDVSEAFATANHFQRELRLYVIALMVAVSFLSLLLAGAFTKPIERILATIRRVKSGDLDAKIQVVTKDEFGQLGRHFNQMLDTLSDQRQLIEQKSHENEALLLNILPPLVANRVKEGKSALAENFPSVTVLVAHVDNATRRATSQPANNSADLLNRIIAVFDAVAEERAVERIRAQGSTYLAVSGLNIPQLDHPRQMIEFARALRERVDGLRSETGLPLSLRVAIHTGPVIAGIVGSRRFIYDVWGETVNTVYQAQAHVPADTLAVTQSVYEATRDQFAFEPLDDMTDVVVKNIHLFKLVDGPARMQRERQQEGEAHV